MRSTRNQPFCWQEIEVLRLLRIRYSEDELVKIRCIYLTITEIESCFPNKEVILNDKLIKAYSGLPIEWISKGMEMLKNLNIIGQDCRYES